jgi:hypothetical protein
MGVEGQGCSLFYGIKISRFCNLDGRSSVTGGTFVGISNDLMFRQFRNI